MKFSKQNCSTGQLRWLTIQQALSVRMLILFNSSFLKKHLITDVNSDTKKNKSRMQSARTIISTDMHGRWGSFLGENLHTNTYIYELMTNRITMLWSVQTIKMFTHLSTSSAKGEKNLSPPHEMQFTDFCFDCTYRLKAAFLRPYQFVYIGKPNDHIFPKFPWHVNEGKVVHCTSVL